jgi:hypothetical protein
MAIGCIVHAPIALQTGSIRPTGALFMADSMLTVWLCGYLCQKIETKGSLDEAQGDTHVQ